MRISIDQVEQIEQSSSNFAAISTHASNSMMGRPQPIRVRSGVGPLQKDADCHQARMRNEYREKMN
jgi:hypothetical protein